MRTQDIKRRIPKIKLLKFIVCIFGFCAFVFNFSFAQEQEMDILTQQDTTVISPQETEGSIPAQGQKVDASTQEADISTQEGNITIDFKDVDIQSILRILAEKGNVNIVAGKDVVGKVTIKLVDVSWQRAMEVVLKTYGYGYERDGNVITVSPVERLTELKRAERELTDIEPVITKVFVLKYLDANSAMSVVQSQLSGQGKIAVLNTMGKKGWEFGGSGGSSTTKLERAKEQETLSRTLVVTDVPSYIEKVAALIEEIDIMPKQVLIETKIVEVSHDKLRDLGLDIATGASGAETSTISSGTLPGYMIANRGDSGSEDGQGSAEIIGHALGRMVTPSVFNAKAAGISSINSGLMLVYKKLTGNEFEAILNAFEEDVTVNTLSNPRILTLNNQEATILVGTKYPILEANITGTGAEAIITTTLKYYENIGIQLNVVPQISGTDYINMIVHPAVTSYTTTLKAKSATGETLAEYPILNTREAETQVFMKDGETVVIGGLLKDVTAKSNFRIPIISKIPLIGALFQRETVDTEKIDLLIFITSTIVNPAA